MQVLKKILSTPSSWSYDNHHIKSAAALSPTLKNANVTCTPAGTKVKRMLAIISLPLIPVLTTGFPREKYLGGMARFTRECMKSMSGCFCALGGWLARHHEPCCSVSAHAFSCNVQSCWLQCRMQRQQGQATAVQHRGTATQRPYMSWDL